MLDKGEIDFAILLLLEEMIKVDHITLWSAYASHIFGKLPIVLTLIEEGILYRHKHFGTITFSSQTYKKMAGDYVHAMREEGGLKYQFYKWKNSHKIGKALSGLTENRYFLERQGISINSSTQYELQNLYWDFDKPKKPIMSLFK